MKQLLQDLRNSKLVRVTGSYADGTHNENSDIDFYVKPDHPDWRMLGKERNIEKVKKILDKHGIKVQSHTTGYWFSHGLVNDISLPLEFSDLFHPRPNRKKEVSIFDVTFKTY